MSPYDDGFEGLLNVDRLMPWLREHLGVAGPIEIVKVSTGHSNEMFRLHAGGSSWILRRPPRVKAHASASNMSREFRVMSALAGTDVPHARPVALCSDDEIIGVPFFLMELVVGFKGLPEHFPPEFTNPAAVRELSLALVDSLARIHRLDWRACGLDGFGRPEGFLDRQVDRWMHQLSQYQTRELPHLREITGWLRTNQPADATTAIMHGDYSAGNVMFDHARPGRVVAVVDWENATIGDPMIDLASLLRSFPERLDAAPRVIAANDHLRLSDLAGAPTRSELARCWADVAGRDVPEMTYYDVLSSFRVACILEGSYSRFVRGESKDPYHAVFETRVPALLSDAAARIDAAR